MKILWLIVLFCGSGISEPFTPAFQWSFINFTWSSESDYNDAIASGRYIPENNAMTGIKFYKDKLYIAMPRIRDGTPVTLGYISTNSSEQNPLITPFPDWESNDLDGCDNKLENVQGMEIDQNGIMWVIDGYRSNARAKCPPKLVLYDLNNNNSVVHSFDFPQTVCLNPDGFLNDIVVDGDFAYITDHSLIDPGLIVYSRAEDRAWKFREASMWGERNATGFVVDGIQYNNSSPIDGIALSSCNDEPRLVYYCALTAFGVYAISTDILQNEDLASGDDWTDELVFEGNKQAQTDGMVLDDQGNLYYGLLPLNGVGRWNTKQPISTSEIVEVNNQTIIWPDCFAFDDNGYLYFLANHIIRYFNLDYNLELTDETKFTVFQLFTSTHSYLYGCS